MAKVEGRDTMLEIDDLMDNATCFHARFRRHSSPVGCMGFFYSFSNDEVCLKDALIIEKISKLINESTNADQGVKIKVTQGIYFLIWSRYNSLVSSYLHHNLINQIQHDLGFRSLEDIGRDDFNQALNLLGYLCTEIYNQREEPTYKPLYELLGPGFQSEISSLCRSDVDDTNTWYGGYSKILCCNF